MGKGKSCSQGGGGFEGVTTPAPPQKILIIHLLTFEKLLMKFTASSLSISKFEIVGQSALWLCKTAWGTEHETSVIGIDYLIGSSIMLKSSWVTFDMEY